jgi:hypothetical protein
MKDWVSMLLLATFVLVMNAGVFSLFQAPTSSMAQIDSVYSGPAINEGAGPGTTDYPPQYGQGTTQVGVGGGPPIEKPEMCIE